MMFSRKKSHNFLVENGAPILPDGMYYTPVVVFVDREPLLRMEVRKPHGWFRYSVEGFYTIDPSTYFNEPRTADSVLKDIIRLCFNARSNATIG